MERFHQRYWRHGWGLYHHFKEAVWRPWLKVPFVLFLCLLLGLLFTKYLINTSVEFDFLTSMPKKIQITETSQKPTQIIINCRAYMVNQTCPLRNPTSLLPEEHQHSSRTTCPEYFRWIHEDLHPWSQTGITRKMLERAKQTANFKLVILKGKAYYELYERTYQTRDIFTLWGVLQLLRRYPGKLPDLELMFDCRDWPILSDDKYGGTHGTTPPPLFRYCGSDDTLDIVFPDWTFWGWPEVSIKPWESYLKDLKEANKRTKWINREPYAYWKGNSVHKTRQDLLQCNVSGNDDWQARLYNLDWGIESIQGFPTTDLADQCTHRYKIYVEGRSWSTSGKYTLACDSVALFITPRYYDFFTRGLMPLQHYWPIQRNDKCRSIEFAVEWGNNHTDKAEKIGKTGSDFIQQELTMDHVYDYLFHLLSEYAKLLKFEPTIGANAVELCEEAIICGTDGLDTQFLMETMVKSPTNTLPCTLPPPYDPASVTAILSKKENSINQVESWEKDYWEEESEEPFTR